MLVLVGFGLAFFVVLWMLILVCLQLIVVCGFPFGFGGLLAFCFVGVICVFCVVFFFGEVV